MKRILFMVMVISLFACDKANCCNNNDGKCKHAVEQGCDKPCDKHKDCPKDGKCKHHKQNENTTEMSEGTPHKGCKKGGVDKCKMKGKKCGSMMDNDDEKLIYYTCPMDAHKHIRGREAGKCSECGMDMVAGVITTKEKADFYGCPMVMHSHIRSDEAGACKDCGMNLEPMRLVK